MVRSEAGGEGVLVVVVTGRFIFGGGEEEGGRGIGRRGGDRLGVWNDPRNDNGTVIRAGVQSSNLTY